MDTDPDHTVICPKCQRAFWSPYRMTVKGKGKLEIVNGEPVLRPYVYLVFRHPDGRRHTPRKCTVRVTDLKTGKPVYSLPVMDDCSVKEQSA